MMDKHPISKGQPSEFTTCWREHTPGAVCLREEGHDDIEETDLAVTEAVLALIAASGFLHPTDEEIASLRRKAEIAIEAARPVILRAEHVRLLALIDEELAGGMDPASLLGTIRVGLRWSVE